MSFECQGRQAHGHFGHGTCGPKPKPPQPGKSLATSLNIADLAAVIYNEARGEPDDAKTAVGWTILNRMKHNEVNQVDKVWRGYNHGMVPSASQHQTAYIAARKIAIGILNGTTADPTQGATHFYSPQHEPKEDDPIPKGYDVKGGLESVDGVYGKNGLPARNYRPSLSVDTDHFTQVQVPGINDYTFKFYKPVGGGHVR